MSEQCHVYEPLRRALLGNCGVAIEEVRGVFSKMIWLPVPYLNGNDRVLFLQTVADESLQVAETRSQCGCRCEGQKCVPEQCECALSGIRCQVEGGMNPSEWCHWHCPHHFGTICFISQFTAFRWTTSTNPTPPTRSPAHVRPPPAATPRAVLSWTRCAFATTSCRH